MKRKTIIISDLHVWTPDAQPQKLLKFLGKNPCDTLILNWDIIDNRYIKYFWKRQTEYETVFKNIRAICDKNKAQIVYLRGNHETIGNHASWENIQQEIIITSHKKKYLICHGDNFEKELRKPNAFTISLFFIDTFFGRVDRSLSTKYAISHILKDTYAFFTNQKTRFIHNAVAYAKKKKVDGIICGHIHDPTNKMIKGIYYLNSGNRTETCSALTEDSKGNRKILYTK